MPTGGCSNRRLPAKVSAGHDSRCSVRCGAIRSESASSARSSSGGGTNASAPTPASARSRRYGIGLSDAAGSPRTGRAGRRSRRRPPGVATSMSPSASSTETTHPSRTNSVRRRLAAFLERAATCSGSNGSGSVRPRQRGSRRRSSSISSSGAPAGSTRCSCVSTARRACRGSPGTRARRAAG